MRYAVKNYNTNLYIGEDGFTSLKEDALKFDTFSQAELVRRTNDHLVTIEYREPCICE